MKELAGAFAKAAQLIITFDPQVLEVTFRTLRISLTSTIIAGLLCLPFAGIISFSNHSGKRAFISFIQTLYSLPTICVGLLVFILFSRSGPFGNAGILFTPSAMVIAQIILISPILLGLTISGLSSVDKPVKDTAVSLGASRAQVIWTVIKEARFSVISGITMGFGRAISEVGCAIIVGGNIKGFTRILTTSIALETQRGELELALALGIILLTMALIINLALSIVEEKSR